MATTIDDQKTMLESFFLQYLDTLLLFNYFYHENFGKNTIIIYPIQHLLEILQYELWKCFARQKSKILLWRWQKIYIKSCYVSIPQNFF